MPQNYYRKHKVPNPFAGARPRSFFSRGTGVSPPVSPVSPRPQAQPASNPYRHSATVDNAPPRFTAAPHIHHQAYGGSPGHSQYYFSPYQSDHPLQPQHRPPSSNNYSSPSSLFAQQPQASPLQEPPQPNPSTEPRSPLRTQRNPTPSTPPQRHRTTSTRTQAQTFSSPPVPTLDQLLVMTQNSINALSIGVLKSILFTNHVNASMILEKSELVSKVMALVDDERGERERQRLAEEAEGLGEEERREEREGAIRREQEDRRRNQEEQLRTERRERYRTRVDEAGDGVDTIDVDIKVVDENEDQVASHDESTKQTDYGSQARASASAIPQKTSAVFKKPASFLERSGLCVICQDEEANIAIVDCGCVHVRPLF